METTFITIHDLSLDARLLYVSDSIVDILGYSPQEVVGRSCWEYFHPDEVPFARAIHGRGVQLDKAAVLNYCQIKNKDGRWVGCECVFTIVHDVLVASTSIYRRGLKSQKRAVEAPIIRQLFSSSPRDPRYHMLSYISSKFTLKPKLQAHEPRAALFLNRFTRTLTIMYATNGLAEILGITADEMKGKSFYYCIEENCLQEAVKCLEGAKANDSIAYLRFWFRDPRRDDQPGEDDHMEDAHSSEEDEHDGGVRLNGHAGDCSSEPALHSDTSDPHRHYSIGTNTDSEGQATSDHQYSANTCSRTSSGNSTDLNGNAHDAIFDQPRTAQSSASSLSLPSPDQERPPGHLDSDRRQERIEVEAVVSCTSDGLVVVLRRARPLISQHVPQPTALPYANGLFASPWAADPIMPNPQQWQQPHYAQSNGFQPNPPFIYPGMAQPNIAGAGGPATADFMNSIREVAVFAWSLTGINGSLAQYGRGKPTGESQPPEGLEIWDPHYTGGQDNNHHHGFQDHQGRMGSNDHTYTHAERPYTENTDWAFWNSSPAQRAWSG
ncbi:MAG: hypothetical protein M1830_007794 [Pleopsidium flavum]|nr:MAG: hypothetical protein M1830_007794 [Pleopsidium flavum]